jgi:hypothetical protein
MKTFTPVHRDAPCRLSLSFGPAEAEPEPSPLDVIERLVNRCATNALLQALELQTASELDKTVGRRLLAKNPDLEPPRYFARLAEGSPAVRRTGVKGRPVAALQAYLALLPDPAVEDFWLTASWSLWKYIHPSAVTAADLIFSVGPQSDPGSGAVSMLSQIDCPVDQAKAFLDLVGVGCPAECLTALWKALRLSVRTGDLRRYAFLYDAWLRCRPAIDGSPLFRHCVEELYSFTSTWFGQVDVEVDRHLFPYQPEYLRALASVIALLTEATETPQIASDPWSAFWLNSSGAHAGLLVRPRADIASFGTHALTGLVSRPSAKA